MTDTTDAPMLTHEHAAPVERDRCEYVHGSTRLGIEIVDAGDPVSGYPVVMSQAIGILDAAVTYSQGTVSARPAASLAGRVYYATDQKIYYQDTGSAWLTVMAAGAWTNLSLASGIIANASFGYTPAYRIVGDMAYLRGTMKNNSGGSLTETQWATLDAVARPAKEVLMTAVVTGPTPIPLDLPASGALFVGGSTTVPNSAVVTLDGCSYSLV